MTTRAGSGMRNALRCNFELRHFWLWRATVAVVTGVAIAAVCGWLVSGSQPRTAAVWISGLVAVAVLVGIGASLAKVEPGTLRRERGEWSFLPASSTREMPEAGELAVAIDLGWFLLLVFTRSAGSGRRWLPAQRLGHQRSWHQLRCAVHAPRPQAAAAMASE